MSNYWAENKLDVVGMFEYGKKIIERSPKATVWVLTDHKFNKEDIPRNMQVRPLPKSLYEANGRYYGQISHIFIDDDPLGMDMAIFRYIYSRNRCCHDEEIIDPMGIFFIGGIYIPMYSNWKGWWKDVS